MLERCECLSIVDRSKLPGCQATISRHPPPKPKGISVSCHPCCHSCCHSCSHSCCHSCCQATISRHPPPQGDIHLRLLIPRRFRLPLLKAERAETSTTTTTTSAAAADEGPRRSCSRQNSQMLVVSVSESVLVDLVCPSTQVRPRSSGSLYSS